MPELKPFNIQTGRLLPPLGPPMLFPLDTATWQTLRCLVRSGGPLSGRDLRVAPTRRTKSGEYLTRLVEIGLLKVVRPAPPRAADAGPLPADHGAAEAARLAFGAVYDLTALGREAAEYGEYHADKVGGRWVAVPAPQPSAPTPIEWIVEIAGTAGGQSRTWTSVVMATNRLDARATALLAYGGEPPWDELGTIRAEPAPPGKKKAEKAGR